MREASAERSFEMKLAKAIMPPEPRKGFEAELRQRISQHEFSAKNRMYPTKKPAIRRWLPATALFLLLVFMMALTNPEFAAAMQRLFRFLPGIGVVDTSQFKVLKEKVEVSREGLSVNVSGAAADPHRTRILLEVEGPPYDYGWGNTGNDRTVDATDDPFLILSDNSILKIESAIHHGDGSGRKYIHRLTFPAIPADTMEVVLAIPRMQPYPPGSAAENWLIPIAFEPGDPALLDPIFEVAEEPEETFSIDEEIEKGCDQDGCSGEAAVPHEDNTLGISFNLERVAEMEDGYLFMIKTSWTSEEVIPYGLFAHLTKVTDADGNPVKWEYAEADRMAEVGENASYSAFKVEEKEITWPLTFRASMIANLDADANFVFNAGEAPQIGQTWQINEDVPIPPYSLRIVSAEAVSDEHGGAGFTFRMTSDNVFSAVLWDINHAPGGAGGGGGGSGFPNAPFSFSSTLTYFALPEGLIEIGVGSISVNMEGPWQITWQPEK